jgi:hypothetical protein
MTLTLFATFYEILLCALQLPGKAEAKGKKFAVTKAPKIQRLVTPVVLQRRCEAS